MTVEDLALQMTPGIGVKGAVHLLEHFGTAERIFAATEKELTEQAELRPEPARQILRRTGFAAAEKEIRYCRKHDIKAIASTDPDYPPLLREIPDYPHVIYVKGEPQVLSTRCLSVVGTRSMTSYGLNMCNRLVCRLAERVPHLAIVSGLAFGIDGAAHRAALVSGTPTVAVLPCPLPGIVPTQHTGVARDMLDHGGALITELHSQTRQNGTAYVARNRIIAALSAGCVVVESPAGGGSLITARFADEYDRTVMAVPGRATDRTSAGTNYLIRNRKAQLVLSAEEIIVEMGWDLEAEPARLRITSSPPALTQEETRLLECFRTSDPLTIDTLRELSGCDPGELAALLLGLELAGVIRQLPGNRYVKLSC
ncbi:MAG: DNA-processing protein DprA [Alistipes sp.]|nr:DNA-processing protein DprA [Alistipes senegalensis]MCM1250603.1 DNA-processing protein DprA [Alistipes sp.]